MRLNNKSPLENKLPTTIPQEVRSISRKVRFMVPLPVYVKAATYTLDLLEVINHSLFILSFMDDFSKGGTVSKIFYFICGVIAFFIYLLPTGGLLLNHRNLFNRKTEGAYKELQEQEINDQIADLSSDPFQAKVLLTIKEEKYALYFEMGSNDLSKHKETTAKIIGNLRHVSHFVRKTCLQDLSWPVLGDRLQNNWLPYASSSWDMPSKIRIITGYSLGTMPGLWSATTLFNYLDSRLPEVIIPGISRLRSIKIIYSLAIWILSIFQSRVNRSLDRQVGLNGFSAKGDGLTCIHRQFKKHYLFQPDNTSMNQLAKHLLKAQKIIHFAQTNVNLLKNTLSSQEIRQIEQYEFRMTRSK